MGIENLNIVWHDLKIAIKDTDTLLTDWWLGLDDTTVLRDVIEALRSRTDVAGAVMIAKSLGRLHAILVKLDDAVVTERDVATDRLFEQLARWQNEASGWIDLWDRAVAEVLAGEGAN